MTADRMAMEAAQSLGQKQVEMVRHSLAEIRAAIAGADTTAEGTEAAAKTANWFSVFCKM